MKNSLKGKRILITAGPTREYMDPVRFLSNDSSGAMGFALAQEARKKGAHVTLISGPTDLKPPKHIKYQTVKSAVEMNKKVLASITKCDVFIATAAVSDYRFSAPSKSKIKKNGKVKMIRMIRNPDILAHAGKIKGKKNWPLLIGFALETGNVIQEGRKKLKNKNLNLVIGNKTETFSSDKIRPTWIERGKKNKKLPSMKKKKLAEKIIKWIGLN